ncbi:TPA: UvrD-helicase domain-containing protein, partial [Pseudomonas aeruginosa]
ELLEGKRQVEGEDDLREQLLRGYRYILVDEYQDIDDVQYRLISALAGRKAEEEGRLCILAVGDDDQNIYAWRDTSNRFIEQFREDYSASSSYLVDNYRSSRNIIEAANQVIERNPHRLKSQHPIKIDVKRTESPRGGLWEEKDPARRGQVLRLLIAGDESKYNNLQAQAATAELQRLIGVESGEWQGCAVLARNHQYLWPIQAWCEQHGVPYYLAADKDGVLPITAQRGFVAVIEYLRASGESLSPAHWWRRLDQTSLQPEWHTFMSQAFAELLAELGDCELGSQAVVDWLYDYARELRQQPAQGLYLGTVHSAKGLEFRHVVLLDGGWSNRSDTLSDERRLYYVGMTRAEQTLTVCEFAAGNPFSRHLSNAATSKVFHGEPLPALEKRYLQLSLKDIDLDFAGRQPAEASIHRALANLNPGDRLQLKPSDGRYLILNDNGEVVGRTAKSFHLSLECESCRVAAVLGRRSDSCEESYQVTHRIDQWELVVPQLISSLTT